MEKTGKRGKKEMKAIKIGSVKRPDRSLVWVDGKGNIFARLLGRKGK